MEEFVIAQRAARRMQEWYKLAKKAKRIADEEKAKNQLDAQNEQYLTTNQQTKGN